MCYCVPFYQNCRRTRVGHQTPFIPANDFRVEASWHYGEKIWIIRCPGSFANDDRLDMCMRGINWRNRHAKDRWPKVEEIDYCPDCEAGYVEEPSEIIGRDRRMQPIKEAAPGQAAYHWSEAREKHMYEQYWGRETPEDVPKEYGQTQPLTAGNLAEHIKHKKKGAYTGDTDDEKDYEDKLKKEKAPGPAPGDKRNVPVDASTSASTDSAAAMPPPPKRRPALNIPNPAAQDKDEDEEEEVPRRIPAPTRKSARVAKKGGKRA